MRLALDKFARRRLRLQVVLAKHAGVCFGVQRALDLADAALTDDAHVFSYGELIHNARVVADYACRGLAVIKTPDELANSCADGARTVVVRSHGVAPEVMLRLQETGARIVDATCPYVLRAQRAAAALGEKYGCVVIVGEAKHPEVEALSAFVRHAGAAAHVVLSPKEVPEALPTQVGVVVQTTQRASVLEAVLGELHARGIAADVSDTICSATQERQDAALALAATVDAMVVVGGKHSSNTTRLAEICAGACARVYHVEDAAELSQDLFARGARVGITAGASTPATQIDAVRDALLRM